MKFIKMHGLGNDFVIMDHRGGERPLSPPQIIRISDRHIGVGCDQLIVMEPSSRADLFMRIYNGDGSVAGACGNATRCVAHLFMTGTDRDSCMIETHDRILSCTRAADDMITVDMGVPVIETTRLFTNTVDGLSDPVLVDMGNPHAVYFVDNMDAVDIRKTGPKIECHPFFENRTNVEFVEVLGPSRLRLRTWERGAGLTLACGSGSCATVAAAVTRGKINGRAAQIDLDGGTLFLEWRADDNHILMTGPVAYVFEGVLHS